MSTLSAELVSLLRYLLPGFLAAWVYLGLTSKSVSSQFERIVQAVIFTVIVQAISTAVIWVPALFLERSIQLRVELAWDVLTAGMAVLIGFLFAVASNKNWPHSWLVNRGLTLQTTFPSEWAKVLSRHDGYVVLHLDDGRRLFGWPAEWPQSSGNGHFHMVQASWLDDDGSETYLEDGGVSGILISSENVEMLELMDRKEQTNGSKGD